MYPNKQRVQQTNRKFISLLVIVHQLKKKQLQQQNTCCMVF